MSYCFMGTSWPLTTVFKLSMKSTGSVGPASVKFRTRVSELVVVTRGVAEGNVALEFEQRNIGDVVAQVGIGVVRRRKVVSRNHHLRRIESFLDKPAGEEDEAGVPHAAGDVVGDGDVAALKPETA